MLPRVAPVEALVVDEVDGRGTGAVEQQLLVLLVFVLQLHLILQELVALPERRILDPLDLQHSLNTSSYSDTKFHFYWLK